MYNRYTPQPDGSHHRNRVQEPARPEQQPAQSRQHKPEGPPPMHHKPAPPQGLPVAGFLKQLLPKNFDTGDLIIVLLLLLMAGDNPEDKGNALLTLALYFIM